MGARGDRALRNRVAVDGLPDVTIEGVESPALRGRSGLLNPNVDLLLKGHIQILARRDAIGKIVARELQHAEIIAVGATGVSSRLSLRSSAPRTRTAFQRVAGIRRILNGLADLRGVVRGASKGDWGSGNDEARNASRTRGNGVSHWNARLSQFDGCFAAGLAVVGDLRSDLLIGRIEGQDGHVLRVAVRRSVEASFTALRRDRKIGNFREEPRLPAAQFYYARRTFELERRVV